MKEKKLYPSKTIEAISEFLFIGKEECTLKKSDLVIVLGSDYVEQTIKVLNNLCKSNKIDGNAKIILTGATGTLNKGGENECDLLFKCAVEEYHLPETMFIKEKRATNACQNFEYSKNIIEAMGGFTKYHRILCIGKDFLMRRASMYAARFEYPVEQMQYLGVVDETGLNIGKNTWWKNEESKYRVLAEIKRIGEYGMSGDLSIY